MRTPAHSEPGALVGHVGALLYYMLTAKKPFRALSNMDFFMKILHEDPAPIEETRGDVPRSTIELVKRCMAKKPEDRYTLEDLAEALKGT